jgi:hypothetical protein
MQTYHVQKCIDQSSSTTRKINYFLVRIGNIAYLCIRTPRRSQLGFILSVAVGCLGGGGGATLLENNNKRLLLFGILLNLPHSKESNPKE